jgi:hypothetical protein
VAGETYLYFLPLAFYFGLVSTYVFTNTDDPNYRSAPQHNSDLMYIREAATNIGIHPDSIKAAFRMGNNSSGHRPLKIQSDDHLMKQNIVAMMDQMRDIYGSERAFARNDMTRAQLQRNWDARQQRQGYGDNNQRI